MSRIQEYNSIIKVLSGIFAFDRRFVVKLFDKGTLKIVNSAAATDRALTTEAVITEKGIISGPHVSVLILPNERIAFIGVESLNIYDITKGVTIVISTGAEYIT